MSKFRLQYYIRNHSPEIQGIIWMLSASFWFSVMAVIIRYLSQSLSPFEMVFMRNGLSLLWMLPWAHQYGVGKITTRRLRIYSYRAVSGICGMCLLFYGLSKMHATDAIALTFTTPLITTILAVFFLKETIGKHRIAALIIGFSGVLIIAQPGAATFQVASIYILCATVSWAISNILIKKLTREDEPRVIVFIMMVLMTPLSLPLALMVWQTPNMEQWFWLLTLGWVTNQAQFSMAHAYSKTDMSVVQPFDFSRLVFVSILSFFAFGEVIHIHTAVGAVIIFLSSIYIARREHLRRLATLPK